MVGGMSEGKVSGETNAESTDKEYRKTCLMSSVIFLEQHFLIVACKHPGRHPALSRNQGGGKGCTPPHEEGSHALEDS